MVATGRRTILNGNEFDHLFPKPKGGMWVVNRIANLSDTLQLIQKVVLGSLEDTRRIAHLLKGKTVKKTCQNIWEFCYRHFQYKEDAKGKEQVRRPSRSWKDRKTGIDCDCFSVLISSILTNLNIPHFFRVTRYTQDWFEHIYVVVPHKNDSYFIDPVINQPLYEVPFTENKDIPMELQYLNGINHAAGPPGIDFDDLFEEEGLAGRAERQMRKEKRKERRQDRREERRSGTTGGGRFANAINRFNPATGLLRLGILAAMKLNMFKIAERLRWAYLTENQVRQKGFNVAVYHKLVKVREKLDKIFFGAGGRRENLKKAIITGKGNKDRAVNGLGMAGSHFDEDSALYEILGSELYESEMSTGLNGQGSLGEVGTGAAIAAATSVLGVIAAILKGIGDIKKGGTPGNASNSNFSVNSGGSFSPNLPSPGADPNYDNFNENIDSPRSIEPNGKGKLIAWLKNKWWIPALGIVTIGGGTAAVVIARKKKKTSKPVGKVSRSASQRAKKLKVLKLG